MGGGSLLPINSESHPLAVTPGVSSKFLLVVSGRECACGCVRRRLRRGLPENTPLLAPFEVGPLP